MMLWLVVDNYVGDTLCWAVIHTNFYYYRVLFHVLERDIKICLCFNCVVDIIYVT